MIRDSTATSRHEYVVDEEGGTAGLHRPGYRFLRGGDVGHQLARDRQREIIKEAYRLADEEATSAWKRRSGVLPQE